jgi:hypothetical protein
VSNNVCDVCACMHIGVFLHVGCCALEEESQRASGGGGDRGLAYECEKERTTSRLHTHLYMMCCGWECVVGTVCVVVVVANL